MDIHPTELAALLDPRQSFPRQLVDHKVAIIRDSTAPDREVAIIIDSSVWPEVRAEPLAVGRFVMTLTLDQAIEFRQALDDVITAQS